MLRALHVIIGLVGILAACSGRASHMPFDPTSAPALLGALATLEGELRDHPTASEIATGFDPGSPRDSALYEAAVAHADSHLAALVDCIADTRPAKVTYRGRAVSRGAVCWWVLWESPWFERHLSTYGA